MGSSRWRSAATFVRPQRFSWRPESIPRSSRNGLGHAQIGITLDTYSHVLPTIQREAASKLDAMMRPADKPEGAKTRRPAKQAHDLASWRLAAGSGVIQRSYVRHSPPLSHDVHRVSVHVVVARPPTSIAPPPRDWLHFGYIGDFFVRRFRPQSAQEKPRNSRRG